MSAQDDESLKQFIALARAFEWAADDVRRTMEEAGVRLSRGDFYSETPTLDEIENSFEYRGASAPFDDQAIFDECRLIEFAADLVAHSESFAPPLGLAEAGPSGFFWQNDQFSYSDAMSLYAVVRKYRPATVLEIGSGHSSRVTAQAIRDNGGGNLVCIDPHPRADLGGTRAQFMERRVQDVSPEALVALVGPGDIVFYDGSHTVKTGSDTVYFYLKVLPRLPSGVLVHCHDIRLPYPQPIEYLTRQKISWSEQYLLLAHLQNTHRYEVLFASFLLRQRCPKVLERLMHGRFPIGGSSLWFVVK